MGLQAKLNTQWGYPAVNAAWPKGYSNAQTVSSSVLALSICNMCFGHLHRFCPFSQPRGNGVVTSFADLVDSEDGSDSEGEACPLPTLHESVVTACGLDRSCLRAHTEGFMVSPFSRANLVLCWKPQLQGPALIPFIPERHTAANLAFRDAFVAANTTVRTQNVIAHTIVQRAATRR